MVNGLLSFQNVHLDCDGCALGKMHIEEFPLNVDRKKRDIMELVDIDISRPMQTRLLSGAYYFLLFTDDCTRLS